MKHETYNYRVEVDILREIPNTLGDIIKNAREKSDITIESLANKVEITERYLYRIENENKKTKF